ncbi:MAG: riboflavin kinase, partial [Oscillospiraceae bacterium]
TANVLLGYEFTIDFPVAHGRSLGKTLGFPTANQIFPTGFIIPKFGVYKTRVSIDGKSYLGITNVGRKPTVGETDFVGAETYLDGFTGDLYEKQVKTSFVSFLRPEIKFGTIEELKNAISNDLVNARKE